MICLLPLPVPISFASSSVYIPPPRSIHCFVSLTSGIIANCSSVVPRTKPSINIPKFTTYPLQPKHYCGRADLSFRHRAMASVLLKTISLVVLTTTLAHGQIEASPEPNTASSTMDGGLYLTTAGFSYSMIRPLRSIDTVCLDDHPTGVGILCTGDGRFATFYQNGVRSNRERKGPFFLTGDVRGRVRAWSPSTSVVVVRCELLRGRAYTSKISVRC